MIDMEEVARKADELAVRYAGASDSQPATLGQTKKVLMRVAVIAADLSRRLDAAEAQTKVMQARVDALESWALAMAKARAGR